MTTEDQEQPPLPPRTCPNCGRTESPGRVIQYRDPNTGRIRTDYREFKCEYCGFPPEGGKEKVVSLTEGINTGESTTSSKKSEETEEEGR